MKCTQCEGHCIPHYQDCMICLRCGRKDLASDENKNNIKY